MAEKGRIATVEFQTADGKSGSKLAPGVVAMLFKFAHGKTVKVTQADIADANWGLASWHGIKQKLADSYAGTKSPVEAFDDFEGQLEQLGMEGGWYADRKSGEPRVADLVEALVKYSEEIGKPQDADAFREKVFDETYRSRAKAIPRVAELMLDIATARRKAAIAEMAKKAAEQPSDFTI